jgi:Domain of unknown function (DUF4349)
MRKPDESTATIERDLGAIDEALSAGAAWHENREVRELQELGLALRSDAPDPDPAFQAELGRRVEAGFPAKPGSRRAWVHRRRAGVGAALARAPRLLPGAGIAAGVLIAVGIAAAGLPDLRSNGDEDAGSGGGGAEKPATVEALSPPPQDPGRGAAGRDAVLGEDRLLSRRAPLPLPDRDFAPGRERRIERSASLTLSAPRDELEQVADGVTAVTDRHEGFVLSSSFAVGEDDETGGHFDLRIPVTELQDALRDLAGLATVISRTQSGRDVTREHVTARDRLQAARAERRGLLRRLELAETDTEAEAIRARLDLVAGEIRGLRSQLRNVRLRADYAAVAVTLEPDDEQGGSSGGSSTDEALDDFTGSLVGAVNVLLRVLGVAIPLAVVGLAAWLAAVAVRRRRRESVLA